MSRTDTSPEPSTSALTSGRSADTPRSWAIFTTVWGVSWTISWAYTTLDDTRRASISDRYPSGDPPPRTTHGPPSLAPGISITDGAA